MPDNATLRRVKDVLWVLALLGFSAIVLRLTRGLGAATALTDGAPWGVWKILNMVAGVALGTGGFAIAFGAHVLGREKLHPIVRPAILTAFIGYASSCFALFLDIGRPERMWHVLVHWNVHSFLFEVAWCVMLYLTVTVLELAPVTLENSRWKKPYRFLRRIGLPVVIAGITFSCLHHTSLGSLFLVSPTRLHGLWYTGMLPVHFILSAVGSGLMFVVLGTLIIGRLYRREVPLALLRRVAGVAASILAIYLVTKVVDLAARGAFPLLTAGSWESTLYVIEIGLAAIVPVALMAWPAARRSTAGLSTAATCAVAGLILNRLDVGIFGFWRSGATSYVPSLSEIAVTLGIPAAAGLLFFFFIERFRVFELGPSTVEAESISCTRFEKLTGVWSNIRIDGAERWSLMAVFVIPVAVLLYSSGSPAEEAGLRPPLAGDATRAVLRIDADRDDEAVLFAHEEHKTRLGGESSCGLCHHLNRPGDQATSCHLCHASMERDVSIFDHAAHAGWVARREGFGGAMAENRTCATCHPAGKPRARSTARACVDCHEEDMGMSRETAGRLDLAPGYASAMHGSCVRCHEEKASQVRKPLLGECATCHEPREKR